MTVEEFDTLDDSEKNILIFEAEKLGEKTDEISKYELFFIDGFYVETRTSIQHKFRRCINTFTAEKPPAAYASKQFAIND